MAKRIGSVIVFKAGVSPAQAAKALEALRDVLDLPATSYRPVYVTTPRGERGVPRYETVPFKTEHLLNEYEEDHGSPVWYVP